MKLIVMNTTLSYAGQGLNQEFFDYLNRFVWTDCGGYMKAVREKSYISINY